MAIRTISAAGGNWNSTATWVGGVIPTSSDSVLGDATSGQLTINVAATCQFVDFTNYTQTLTMGTSNFTFGLAGATSIFGSGMTFVNGTGRIVCNVNHTFTQNTTSRFRLQIGAGTKTLTTNLYLSSLNLSSTTSVVDGNRMYLNTDFSTNSANNRIGGTTELVIDGNTSWSVISWQRTTLPNTPTIIDASGSTITCSTTLQPTGRLEILNGTINFTAQATINLTSGSVPILKITNGQLFTFISSTSGNITFESTPQIQDFYINNTNVNPAIDTTKILTDTNMTMRNIIAGGFGTYYKVVLPIGYTFDIDAFLLTSQYDLLIPTDVYDITIKSNTPGTKVVVNYTGSLCMNYYVNFTDIDASGGNTIFTYNGTISNSDNIQSVSTYPPSLGGGQTAYTFAS